jgi:hypothetical protein
MTKPIGLLAVVAALAVAGCGVGAGTRPAAMPSTPTTTTMPALTTTTPAPMTATSAPAATTVVVPNGVGLNYQQAQDAWRGAGLHVLPATDAKGTHRLPVIDANWVVLSQDPAAGVQVNVGSFITATVKKYTDG